MVPSALPLIPARPATVLTTQLAPLGATFRIVWLRRSATKRLVALSTATPAGRLKRALVLVPSLLPLVLADPAMVLTTQLVPTGLSFRIVSFSVSAT